MKLKIIAFVLGFNCFVVQLVLLREFMSFFNGNELVIGITLALWMLFTALGAWSGRFFPGREDDNGKIIILIFMMGIMPVAGAFLPAWFRNQLYAPGQMISLQGTLLMCSAGLVLFCLASGLMFSILASAGTPIKSKENISRIYAIEAAGGLAGGALFNFFLVYALEAMQILSIIMMLNLLVAFWYACVAKWRLYAYISMLISLILIPAIIIIDLDHELARLVYPRQNILFTADTPYGKMVVTGQHGQQSMFHNGQPVVSWGDAIEREEKVHYAMSLHPAPKDVLLLFGGLDGAIEEVLKYQYARPVYVDPELRWHKKALSLFRQDTILAALGIQDDPRRYLNNSEKSYDIILLSTSSPSTIGTNRYYTKDFFAIAHRRLHPGGIFSIRLPTGSNYLDESTRLLYSSVYNTLKVEFQYVRIIPGNHCYFIASDTSYDANITETIRSKEVPTLYVNEWYVDDASIAARASLILKALDPEATPNSDQRPLASYLSIKRWLDMFHIPVWLLIFLPLLFMGILLIRLAPVNIGLFTSGFTASSAEFILLIAFQLIYGYLYQMAGLVIMSFMLGLAIGSAYLHRYINENRQTYIRNQMIIGIFMVLMPFILEFLLSHTLPLWLPGLAICLLTLISAAITGMQYRLATILLKYDDRKVASSSYGADLAGSAFGIFLVAAFIYPLAGMLYTCLALAVMNFLASLLLKWHPK